MPHMCIICHLNGNRTCLTSNYWCHHVALHAEQTHMLCATMTWLCAAHLTSGCEGEQSVETACTAGRVEVSRRSWLKDLTGGRWKAQDGESEDLMVVVVLKFGFFWQMLREKKYLLLQKQTGVEKGLFYKLGKELYNISCSFPVWFVWLKETCKIIMKPLVKYASLLKYSSQNKH